MSSLQAQCMCSPVPQPLPPHEPHVALVRVWAIKYTLFPYSMLGIYCSVSAPVKIKQISRTGSSLPVSTCSAPGEFLFPPGWGWSSDPVDLFASRWLPLGYLVTATPHCYLYCIPMSVSLQESHCCWSVLSYPGMYTLCFTWLVILRLFKCILTLAILIILILESHTSQPSSCFFFFHVCYIFFQESYFFNLFFLIQLLTFISYFLLHWEIESQVFQVLLHS